MKIKEKTSDLEVIGKQLESVKSFVSKKNAYKILDLVVGIYSDPILAVLRELVSNAYDANVDKGNPNAPLLVGLYEKIIGGDWELVIKDEGYGMSQEFMRTKFSSIFESTKNDSNDAVGAFGIGSKSPLNYYTGTAIFDCISEETGRRLLTSWLLTKDNGSATITKLYEKETFESTGTTVRIPVNKDDIDSFYSKARQLIFFPNIIFDGHLKNISNIQYEEYPNYYKINSSITDLKNKVALGPALYSYQTDLYEDYDYTIIPKFSIGELEISPTREKINDNHWNNNKLKNRFNLVLFEIGQKCYDILKNQNIFELLKNNFYNYNHKRDVYRPDYHLIETYIKLFNKSSYFKELVKLLNNSYNISNKLSNRLSYCHIRKYKNGSFKVFNKNGSLLDYNRNQIHIFVKDLDTKSISKYVKSVNLKDEDLIIIINDYEHIRNKISFINKDFLEMMGGYDYRYSQLTPVKTAINKKVRDFTKINYLSYSDFNYNCKKADDSVKITDLEKKVVFYSYVGNAKNLIHKKLSRKDLTLFTNKHGEKSYMLLLTNINEYKRLKSMKDEITLVEIKDIVENVKSKEDIGWLFLHYLLKTKYGFGSTIFSILKLIKESNFNSSYLDYYNNNRYESLSFEKIKYWLTLSENHEKAQELFRLANHLILYPEDLLESDLCNLKSLYIFDKTYRPDSISLASKYIYDIPKMNDEIETLKQTYEENISSLNQTIQKLVQ